MNYVDLVAIAALIQYQFFGFLVGRARGKYGVPGPATSGHELFERAYRVQMNTLELLVVFLPALYLANKYWTPTNAALAGAVYLIGRFIFWRAYMTNPASRGLGFMLSLLPCAFMLVGALVGVLRSPIG
jgi:uncharacterized MAPEG superfamily protein